MIRRLPRVLIIPLSDFFSRKGYHSQALDLVPVLDASPALRAGIYSYFAESHSVFRADFSLDEGIAFLSCRPDLLPDAECAYQWIMRLSPKRRIRAFAFLCQIGFREFPALGKLLAPGSKLPSWVPESAARNVMGGSYQGIDKHLLRFNELKTAENHEAARRVMEEIFHQEGLTEPSPWLFKEELEPVSTVPERSVSDDQKFPKITIIVCAWNAEKYLSVALSSILAQSYPNLEIIAINDGSTDSTQEILERFLGGCAQARILSESLNRGTYECRNKGLELATGEYVMYHDSDDWSHPWKVEWQWMALQNCSGALASSSNWFRIDPETGQSFARRVFPICRWNCSSFMFHRASALEHLGFFDPVKAGADSEYVARFEAVFGPYRHVRLKSPLSIGLEHRESLTRVAGLGFDTRGLSPSRQSYTETWRTWHAAKAHEKKGLKLERGRSIEDSQRSIARSAR